MLRITMVTMIDASTRWPSEAEMMLAMRRMTTSGLPNSWASCTSAENRRLGDGSFGPNSASRAAASELVSPTGPAVTACSSDDASPKLFAQAWRSRDFDVYSRGFGGGRLRQMHIEHTVPILGLHLGGVDFGRQPELTHELTVGALRPVERLPLFLLLLGALSFDCH